MNISWLKLDVNIFNDSKIKIIRKYPDGNSLIVLWIGLLCLAMKSDKTGYIYITDGIPYTTQDLANEFDIEIKTVEMGLGLFKNFNMIDVIEGGIIEVINFKKHQNIEYIENQREKNRIKQQRYRDKQRNQLLPSNETVKNHIRIEQNRTDKIRLDKNNKEQLEKNNIIKEIIDYLNLKANKRLSYKNKKHNDFIIARLNDGFNLADFKTVIDIKCEQWVNDKIMNRYLRPETLFGTKFEGYLNEKTLEKSKYNDKDFEVII